MIGAGLFDATEAGVEIRAGVGKQAMQGLDLRYGNLRVGPGE